MDSPPPVPSPAVRWRLAAVLRDVAAAVRGTSHDYTSGSVRRALLLLAVPMVLEMAIQSVFAVVDVYWVASLGPEAVAAVGLTESVLSLLYAVGMGLAMSAAAVVARRVGERDRDGAARAAVQAVALALGASVPFALVGLFFAGDVLRLMGADAETVAVGAGYAAWSLGANAVILLLFMLNAVFRGAGDAAVAMRVLWVASGINLVLDPVLIFGWGPFPEMGVTGAAVATTIGRGVGVGVQVAVLVRGSEHLRVRRRHVRLDAATVWRLARTSVGGVGQLLVATTSWVFLTRIVAAFGAETLAGYTIGLRVFLFTLLPAWGLANAAATIVGQSLGAGKPERAEAAVWTAGRVTMAVLGAVSVGYVVYAEALVRVFSDVPGVVAVGASCLRTMAYGYVLLAWAMVFAQAFNGAGDTATPTRINLLCYWLWQVPLAYGLAVLAGWGPVGVFGSVVAGQALAAAVGLVLFRRGHWKRTRL